MILTGSEIVHQMNNGKISISPFVDRKLNPNSYNVSITDEVLMLECNSKFPKIRDYLGPIECIDPKLPMKYTRIKIDPDGIILMPDQIYLASTAEEIKSDEYIAMITGRSTSGKSGLQCHLEAGFGDVGFHGNWTLQLKPSKPYILYPNAELAQVYFVVSSGDTDVLYHGKYQSAHGIVGSKSYMDYEAQNERT